MPYRLDTDKRVHIYMDEFYCLHNFSAFRLLWEGFEFDTSEHAYHWEKFANWKKEVSPAHYYDYAPPMTTFVDVENHGIRSMILRARSAHEAFKIAEEFKDRVSPEWNQHRVFVMKKILLAKLDQHEYVRRKLLETGDRIIVEDSWRDDFWGWGKNRDGQNMLGKLWMKIRDEIRERDRMTPGMVAETRGGWVDAQGHEWECK